MAERWGLDMENEELAIKEATRAACLRELGKSRGTLQEVMLINEHSGVLEEVSKRRLTNCLNELDSLEIELRTLGIDSWAR